MRRKNVVEEKVQSPSRGLITRIPPDQLPKTAVRGAVFVAQNMRFDDGVSRNAPGFKEIQQPSKLTDDVNLIFQEPVVSSLGVRNNPLLGTVTKIFWVRRRDNTWPVVSAGLNLIVFGLNTVLSGTATDPDTQPSTLILQWVKVSGPGTASFGSPTLASTSVLVSMSGTYVFRLVATDGAARVYSDCEVKFT